MGKSGLKRDRGWVGRQREIGSEEDDGTAVLYLCISSRRRLENGYHSNIEERVGVPWGGKF